MRYPRKLPAGAVHRSDRSWLCSCGLRGLYLRTTNLRPGGFNSLRSGKSGTVGQGSRPVLVFSLLNRNGGRRRVVHASLRRPCTAGPPGCRAAAAVRYRRSRGGQPLTCCSCHGHGDLSLPGYGGIPQRGASQRPAAAAWRRIGPRAGPGRLLAWRHRHDGAPRRAPFAVPARGPGPGRHTQAPRDWKTLIPAGRRGEKRND